MKKRNTRTALADKKVYTAVKSIVKANPNASAARVSDTLMVSQPVAAHMINAAKVGVKFKQLSDFKLSVEDKAESQPKVKGKRNSRTHAETERLRGVAREYLKKTPNATISEVRQLTGLGVGTIHVIKKEMKLAA